MALNAPRLQVTDYSGLQYTYLQISTCKQKLFGERGTLFVLSQKPHPWKKVFRPQTPEDAIELTCRLLEYTPKSRLHPLDALAHEFFNELRIEGARTPPPSSRELPPLFNFSEQELRDKPQLRATLIPSHFSTIISNGP